MRKCFLIAISNMKKAKGQTVVIIVLIFIAAVMLNLWLMLSMDYKANFDRYHNKLNAEHVTVTLDDYDGEGYEFLTQMLSKDSKVSEFYLDRCLHRNTTFSFNGGETNSWFIYLDKQKALSRTIGKAEIIEDSSYTSGIYMPMIYKTDEIAVGKTIELTIGSNPVEYTICGFFNSIMAGSNNCGLTEIIMTQDKYDELEKLNYAFQSTLCSVRLKDKLENLKYEATLKSLISEKFPDLNMVSNSYDIVIQARYISQMICSGIMSAMAFFVLLISLIVIASNIINYVQVNIKNLGVFKAVGYTSRQLIFSLLLQFLGLTLISAILGSGLSYCIFPAVNQMMIAQTGIPYSIHFLPLPILISLLILGGTVAVVVWLASRKIKKIEPIVALKSGLQTHNFKHNHIPLEKTKAPLNFALALKTCFSNVKQNITVCITLLVLSFVMVFSGLMVENVIADMTPFLNLIVGETAESCISVDQEVEEAFLDEMFKDSRVEKVYLQTTLNVTNYGGAELLANICDDFSKVNNQNVVFKGRFPKYDNEIAIGAKYAKENGFTIGSEILITANGKIEKYLITGFTQISNYLGRDCLLTRDGYERLGTLTYASYYINLTDGTDPDEFNLEIKERFGKNIQAIINITATIASSAKVYVSLMTIIVIAIFIISGIIIAFVLFLLVRTMLNNKKKEYGVLKALGFTSGQLILQTTLSFMPTILVSIVIGLTISCLVINPLTALFLSGIGIVKCTFKIPVVFTIEEGVFLVLFAFVLLYILSMRIKKISSYQILIGE